MVLCSNPFKAFTIALPAARKIFSTIDRVSPLNPGSQDGLKLEDVEGRVELQNIKHIYPSRPEVCVMDNVSLVFAAGKTTALVGASGSGKSTIIGLIERFYEPIGGKILIDGHDISTLNLRWMRQQLALVSQEVTTFLNCSFRSFDVFSVVLLIVTLSVDLEEHLFPLELYIAVLKRDANVVF